MYLSLKKKNETQPLRRDRKTLKNFKVLLIFNGFSKRITKYHFYFKHIILTCDVTCFRLVKLVNSFLLARRFLNSFLLV